MKNFSRRFVGILLSIFIILGTSMVNMAQTNLWNAYEKFIPAETPILKRHLRGAWISTVVNLDWPSTETVKIGNTVERITKSKEELTEILDRAVELKLNAVFFQVSPEGMHFTNQYCSVVPLSYRNFWKRSRFRPVGFCH